MTNKPPYTIPSMTTIQDIPWNGYNVVSTFSGCGGSCLGFEMEGFRICWANEFIPAAAEVYRLNHPGVVLNTEDIRTITAESILDTIGLAVGELDILEGSPPCASFSTSGTLKHDWGKIKKYSDTSQRVDDLFWEYIRLVKGLSPKVFIAENVSGLVTGVSKGYFKRILAEFKECGYNVQAKVLDAQWLGVPQARQRLIFIGVRNDLALFPKFPTPLPFRYTLRDALPWLKYGRFNGKWTSTDRPTPTLTAIRQWDPERSYQGFELVESETDITRYAIGKEWEIMRPGTISSKYLNLTKPSIDRSCPTVTAMGGHPGTASVTHPTERRKFSIRELKRISSFPDDFQLTGTYEKQWERLGRAVPPLMAKAIAETVRDLLRKTSDG